MKIFFVVIGVLSFLFGVPGFLGSISAVQQTAGMLGILIGVVSLGIFFLWKALDDTREILLTLNSNICEMKKDKNALAEFEKERAERKMYADKDLA